MGKRQGVSIFLRKEDGRDAICGGEGICLNAGVFTLSIEIGVFKLLLKESTTERSLFMSSRTAHLCIYPSTYCVAGPASPNKLSRTTVDSLVVRRIIRQLPS